MCQMRFHRDDSRADIRVIHLRLRSPSHSTYLTDLKYGENAERFTSSEKCPIQESSKEFLASATFVAKISQNEIAVL